MNKFNRKTVVFKKARDSKAHRLGKKLAERSKGVKKAVSGARTGKHKRQVERKWAKAQKEALESGVLTAEDIQMIVQQQDEGAQMEDDAAPVVPEGGPAAPAAGHRKGQKARAGGKPQRASLRIRSITAKGGKGGRAGQSTTSMSEDQEAMVE
eukprot:TRINITY_DN2196_c4_g1_i1.p1 TRINITY_DN2196_c4_g1~~TRINITY_DN2196_c4_g1_i1.p1  ORF type:complete len:153 (-),score=43.35 TRINITY_DN2196_c4_g1_i1:1430-1888(-)